MSALPMTEKKKEDLHQRDAFVMGLTLSHPYLNCTIDSDGIPQNQTDHMKPECQMVNCQIPLSGLTVGPGVNKVGEGLSGQTAWLDPLGQDIAPSRHALFMYGGAPTGDTCTFSTSSPDLICSSMQMLPTTDQTYKEGAGGTLTLQMSKGMCQYIGGSVGLELMS